MMRRRGRGRRSPWACRLAGGRVDCRGSDKVHVPRMGIGWSLDRAVALAGSRLWSLVPRLWSRYLSVAAEQSCHGRLLGLTATLATLASPHCNSEGETSRG